jgi:hypothetical protein
VLIIPEGAHTNYVSIFGEFERLRGVVTFLQQRVLFPEVHRSINFQRQVI